MKFFKKSKASFPGALRRSGRYDRLFIALANHRGFSVHECIPD
jgi:hypothetical protein